MADRRSEHLIRIIVQGVNRLGDVVDKGTRAVDKHTGAVERQSKAIDKGGRTAKEAQADFERFTKAVRDGEKDYESARFGLQQLAAEMDRLAKREAVGSRLSEDLHRSALAAKALSDQLRVAHEAERKIAEDEVRDRVRRERERQTATEARVKAEAKSEKDTVQQRKSFLSEILDEVRRDHDEQLRLGREIDAQDAKDHQARLRRRIDEAVAHSQAAAARTPTPLGRGVQIAPAPRRSFVQRVRSAFSDDDSDQPGGFAVALGSVSRTSRSADSGVSRLERTISRLSSSSDQAGFSIAKVDNNLRGLLVVGVIAFSQQLVSAFVALAASALAVASAAAQAGAALGGAFVAAAGQALPTIGILISAFGRIGAVFEAVELFNAQATKSGYDQAASADRQAAAADRVTTAQEQTAAASRRVQDATDALTEARERALQKIEDLDLAERNASRSQFEAGRAVSRAIASGDVGALEGLRIRQDEAGVDVGRTRSEASSARSAGVDRAPEVLRAVRDLDDANVALERSRRELDAAGRSATRAAEAGSAADRSLQDALEQLTPAEFALYESAKRIQARFRTLFRPVTDVIVRAFTRGVDRASDVLDDSRIIGAARKIADALAESLDVFSEEATSDRSLDFFETMGDEAERNIPLLTRLGVSVNRILSAIAVASGPALRAFIEFFVDLAERGEEATNSKSGMARLERFFLRGEEMTESFLRLGGAIIGLFAALAGAGGAETGKDLVDDLTGSIQEATRWIEDNRGKVVQFFEDTADATRAIAGGVYAVGRAAVELFSSSKVVAFVDVFEKVFLPALVSVITALGTITFLFAKFLSLPGVSQISSVALSVLFLFKAFSVFGKLLVPMAAGLLRIGGALLLVRKAASALRIVAALIAGPWGLAIAAIITGAVLLDKKFHFIRPTIEFLGELFRTVFGAIKDVVSDVVPPVARFLGVVLVGAFGVVRDVVVKFIDVWLGMQTMLLGGLSTLASLGSRLPFVGDKFKGLAKFIDGAREKIDGYRESLRELGKEHDRAPGKIERLRAQVDKLRGRLSHLKDGTEEYRMTAERLRRKQGQLNDAMAEADAKGKKGARGPRAIGVSAASAARAVDRANASIAKGFNQIAKQLGGVKAITYSASGATTTFGDGQSVTADTGDITAKATGGWVGSGRGRQGPDDKIIRVGDNEAVLAVPHQRPVEEGLALRSMIKGGPSTLDQLFSRVKGYVGAFATGGRVANFGGRPTNVNPHVKRLIALMQSKFPLSVTSTTDHSLLTTSGKISDHVAGNAVDLSGAKRVMFQAAEYVKSSGLYKRLKQGIHNPNLAVNRGVLQDPPGQFAGQVWAQHANHLHLAIAGALGKLVAGAGGMLGGIETPRISGPAGRLRDLAGRAVKRLTRAANKKLESLAPVGADPGGAFGSDAAKAQGADADVVEAFRRAILTSRASPVERLALFMAGIVESGLRNLSYGDRDSVGALQQRPSQGWTGLTNPFRAALEFISRAQALRPWSGSAGRLAQAVQRSAYPERYDAVRERAMQYLDVGGAVRGRGEVPAVLHGDEHVVTADEVRAAGGHGVLYAMRRMWGGGGQGRSDSYADGGKTSGSGGSGYSVPTVFDTSLAGVVRELTRARGAIGRLRTRSTKFSTQFARSIEQITGDGGLLDQGTAALKRLTTDVARRLKQLTYRITKSGLVVRRLSPQEQARAQVGAIDQQLSGLRSLRGAASSSLDDVDRRLTSLRRGGVSSKERKAYETLVAARRSLVTRIDSLDGQIADSIEARFQAQEQVVQSAVDAVNATASRSLVRADLTDRLATLVEGVVGGRAQAFGLRGQALSSRGLTLRQQRDALGPLLASAQQQGSTEIAADLVAQIEDLNVAIAENSSAIAQNTVAYRAAEVDAINRVASRRLAGADLADRVATLVEASGNATGAFGLRRGALSTRRDALLDQRVGLQAQLAQAQASFGGTTAEQQQIDELIDQIADLGVQLDENAGAIAQNTVAARQAAIDAITGRGGFLGSVFGGLSGIAKALGQLSGSEDVGRLRDLTRAAAAALQQTSSGLRDQLLQGFGVDLRGLSPSALVETLGRLNFDSIEANLSVEQRQQFEALVAAIIDNASAVIDNTQQLSDLNGTTRQSFSTTAWQLFREAIFNGSGGLLQQYRFGSTMPQPIANSASAAVLGSPALRSSSSSATGQAGGDTINVNLTNPTKTTDPQWIGEVIATKRPLARAGR